MFGFLFLVVLILIITCSETTVLLCYFHLAAEDYHWWWRRYKFIPCNFLTRKKLVSPVFNPFYFSIPFFSYLTSGFTAFYFFAYAAHYYSSKLTLEGIASGILYFGYTFLMAIVVFLFTGTIGFIACYWFVRKIYGAVKVD